MARKVLVLGASGFLGSHLTRRLVARGHDVHVFVRASSNTSAVDSLSITKHIGHLWDADKLAGAMQGCSWVFHCVVDTRAWLHDPAPLYRTNVQGLLRVLDAALEARPERFIYTSTYATIGPADQTFEVLDTQPYHAVMPGRDRVGQRVTSDLR